MREIIATKNAMINRNVMGITEVLMSSSLDAVEPIAPYRKAYMRNPSTKKMRRYQNKLSGMLKMDSMIKLSPHASLLRLKQIRAVPKTVIS